ncbi:MAG TPA: 5'/3'-nucleotidase SurE [Solirubrobacterales bacterium]|nr:5'/3'-nucleotidase SurE [Solirubrobacterales bacterium]
MSAPRLVVTNDDGIAAEGLHALVRGLGAAGLPAVTLAPAENRSGVSRNASYGWPVPVERLADVGAIPHYAVRGFPVDCVRVGMLGELGAGAELVVSGINHGPNLGDDTLNSGTVGAAIEGALLGATGLAVSQQHFDGHFHILDSHDPTTPVYDTTAAIAAMFAAAMLEREAPERAVLNVNVPATVREARVEVTRLGRRFYPGDSLIEAEREGIHGLLTYGERNGPPPPYEDEPGTDFGALAAGRVSATPMSFAWHRADSGAEAAVWAAEICAEVERQLAATFAAG